MNIQQLQQLPNEVKDIIFSETSSQNNLDLATTFDLTTDDLKRVIDILTQIYTREISVLEFPAALAKLNIPNVDIRELTLQCALKQLWPLQSYLGDVDRLIIRLGGTVPAVVPSLEPKPVSPEAELIDQSSEGLIQPIKEFIAANSANAELLLSTNYIRDDSGRTVEPTVANWLKDYLHFAGAEASDNLVRSQYLVRSPNTKRLTEAEKTNVLNFLDSYNEGHPMRLEIKDNFLTVAEVGEARPKVVTQEVLSLDQLLESYHQYVSRLQLQIDRLRDGLTVESGNEASRLADLLWNAIGLNERERALVALILLAERQQVSELLRADQRYIGILRRYVNVRFGDRAKSFWQPEWTAANWTLFLQLLLDDKIQLDPMESPMAAEYLGQILQLATPPVYIDLAGGQWRWRTVQYTDKNFILV